jgi:hypothetical protein
MYSTLRRQLAIAREFTWHLARARSDAAFLEACRHLKSGTVHLEARASELRGVHKRGPPEPRRRRGELLGRRGMAGPITERLRRLAMCEEAQSIRGRGTAIQDCAGRYAPTSGNPNRVRFLSQDTVRSFAVFFAERCLLVPVLLGYRGNRREREAVRTSRRSKRRCGAGKHGKVDKLCAVGFLQRPWQVPG